MEQQIEFVGIKQGDLFNSAKELEAIIKDVQEKIFVQLYTRSSQTFRSVRKKIPGIYDYVERNGKIDILKYYEITYCCKFGGRIHSTSKPARTRITSSTRSTRLLNCNSQIVIGISRDCKMLEVKHINDIHCHPVSEVIYKHLPRQRKIKGKDLQKAEELINMKVDNDVLRKYLEDTTGKVVTPRDLQNMKQRIKASAKKAVVPQDGISELLEKLKSKEGASVQVFQLVEKGKDEMCGILYQDRRMQHIYRQYPEVLICGVAYKTNSHGMLLCFLGVVDGNNDINVVAMFLMQSKSAVILESILKNFQEENPVFLSTEVVMTQKGFMKEVFSEVFPTAQLHLCTSDVRREIRSNITASKMCLPNKERKYVMELFNLLVNANDVHQFEQTQQELLSLGNATIHDYYESSWMHVKEQWATCYKSRHHNMGEFNTNRLDILIEQLKKEINESCTLQFLFEAVLKGIQRNLDRRKQDFIIDSTRSAIHLAPVSEDELMFFNHLTPYAYHCVKKEIDSSNESILNDDVLQTEYATTYTTCNCKFHSTTMLPCRHIFTLLSNENCSLYCENLVPLRWTKQVYNDVYVSLEKSCDNNIIDVSTDNSANELEQRSTAELLPVDMEPELNEPELMELELVALEPQQESSENQTIMGKAVNSMNFSTSLRNALKPGISTPGKKRSSTQGSQSSDSNTNYQKIITLGHTLAFLGSNLSQPQFESLNAQLETIIMECEEPKQKMKDPQCRLFNNKFDILEQSNVLYNTSDDVCATEDDVEVYKTENLLNQSTSNVEHSYTKNNTSEMCRSSTRCQDVRDMLRIPIKLRPSKTLQEHSGVSPVAKKRKTMSYFTSKPVESQEQVMLSWILDSSLIDDVHAGLHLIGPADLVQSSKTVSCLDEKVSIEAIKRFFEPDGWRALMAILQSLNNIFFCAMCSKQVTCNCIQCDICIQWCHLRCVGIAGPSVALHWICPKCS